MSRISSLFLSIALALIVMLSCANAEEALFPAKDGWSYGYIRSDGSWAIPPTFTRAYPFQESGLAPVRTEIADLFSIDEPFRMVNREGETAVLLEDWLLDMEYLGVNYNIQTPIIAGNGNLLVHRENHRRRALYLSHTGQLLELTPAFLGYEPPYVSQSLTRLPGEEDDGFYVRDIRLWGDRLVVNFSVKEKWLNNKEIDSEYRYLYILLNSDGKKIHEGVYESPDYEDYSPTPITAPYLPVVQGETIAFIDRDGQVVAEGLPDGSSLTDAGDAIEIEYHKIYQLIETGERLTYQEYAAYRAKKNPNGCAVYENGYVDAQGNPVTFACLAGKEDAEPAEFTRDGVAWVYLWSQEGYHLMDANGNNLTGEPQMYFAHADSYLQDENTLVHFFSQPWEPVSMDDGGMNYLNCHGETLFPGTPFDEADPFCNGLARAVFLAESCKPLELYIDLTGKVVWAEDGREQAVQQWLDSGTVFSPDSLTLEEAKRLIVGEWELFVTCNEGWPIELLEDGRMPRENRRWTLEEADPSIEEYEFELVIYEDGEPVSRDGIHFFSADSFRCYDEMMHGEGYLRVPPGYCAMKEAAIADRDMVEKLPASSIAFGKAGQFGQMELGVLNYRHSAYRDNGGLSASESSELPKLTGLNLLWQQPIGPAASGEDPFWQPLIVKWAKNIRQNSNIVKRLQDTTALKEVIAVGTDQRIHLFELYTGQRTRAPLAGDCYAGTPALHENLPLLAVPGLTGTTFLQMTDGSTITRLESPYHVPKMLLWQNDQMLIQTSNAVTFTRAEGTFTYNGNDNGEPFGVAYLRPYTRALYATSPVSADKDTLYYGNQACGITAYSLKEDSVLGEWYGPGTVVSSIAIRKTAKAGEHPLSLHPQTLLYFGTSTLDCGQDLCGLVCLDAGTMEEQWTKYIYADADGSLPGGCIASPVIGEGPLEGMMYFTLTDLIPTPQEADETYSFLVALDAATGDILWQMPLGGRTVSSPVAALSSDGKGYLYQADGEGNLYMVDGLTGETVDTLSLGGSVTSAPALYGKYLVLRVSKDGQEMLCGVSLE